MSRARVFTAEVKAYLRCGVYASTRAKVTQSPPRKADVGVLLVHGVGADRTQFRALSQALTRTHAWIDAFDYVTRTPFAETLAALEAAIVAARLKTDRLVLVGHSLGGLLLSRVLQDGDVPPHVAGFVAICAPLAGTTRGKLAPWKDLRGITPDGPFIRELVASRDKLDAWGRPILTIGAARDAFLSPADSAFLPGHPTLRLEHSGHVASLFDVRTHAAVADFVREVARGRRG
jgi:pimeloyl-ACP methyl ester carboxylesterase